MLVVLLVIDPAPRHQRLDVRRAVPVAVGAIVLTVILGFVWSNDSTTTSGTAGAQAGAVTIADFAFSPKELDVKVGSKVTWTNTDGTTHSVVADDGSFKSQDLDQGATFTTSFSTPGTFTYVCGIHGSMKGTIVVG